MAKEKPSGDLSGTIVSIPTGHGERLLFEPLRTLLISAINCIFNFKLKFKFTDAFGNVIALQDSEVKCSSQGMTVITPPLQMSPQNGQGGTAARIQMYAITTLSAGDYFLAKTWDGTTLGDLEVAIAKSPRLRPSVALELIDTIPITYTYSDDNNRVADDGTDTEAQVVFPRFTTLADLSLSQPDDLSNCQAVIFAVEAVTGIVDAAGNPVGWIELQPARVWARRYIQ